MVQDEKGSEEDENPDDYGSCNCNQTGQRRVKKRGCRCEPHHSRGNAENHDNPDEGSFPIPEFSCLGGEVADEARNQW